MASTIALFLELWNLQKLGWMNYETLHKYSVAKYTHKVIHCEEDSFFKDQLLLNGRGRNLTFDKLGPINHNLGRHPRTQASYLYIANSIYNEIPGNLTNIDENTRFKKLLKKHYLGILNYNKIIAKPRNKPILLPYEPEIDTSCS